MVSKWSNYSRHTTKLELSGHPRNFSSFSVEVEYCTRGFGYVYKAYNGNVRVPKKKMYSRTKFYSSFGADAVGEAMTDLIIYFFQSEPYVQFTAKKMLSRSFSYHSIFTHSICSPRFGYCVEKIRSTFKWPEN